MPKKQLHFSLQENRQDALARIRGALLKEGIFVDCVALELEFTSVGVCTLWPGELKYENGRYRLFGTLYGHLMDCHGRILHGGILPPFHLTRIDRVQMPSAFVFEAFR